MSRDVVTVASVESGLFYMQTIRNGADFRAGSETRCWGEGHCLQRAGGEMRPRLVVVGSQICAEM